MDKPIQIKDIEHLEEQAKDGVECCVVLNGGLRSSKHMFGFDFCNLGEALQKGSLIRL